MAVAEDFEEFVTIVDAGSLTAAAERLGLPRATLSRRLARLEQRLGVRLLHRTTRRMALTAPGEELYGRARRVVEAAQEAEEAVRRLDGVPRGRLRVSLPDQMPPALLAGWLDGFLEACPEVTLEVVASAVHVDLVGEGFDVALRVGDVDDASLVVRTLGNDLRIAVASPAYLARRGTPETPADLADHDCLVGYRSGTVLRREWPLTGGGSVPVSGTLATNNMALRLEAARRGRGIALVVERLAHRELVSGELVHILPGEVGRRERLSLTYPDRAFLDPKVRAFVDYLSARIAEVRALPRS